MLAVFFGLLSCMTLCYLSNAVPRQTENEVWCDFRGHRVRAGESFQLDPCQNCYCDYRGEPLCFHVMCARPPCVDAVDDPKKCCGVCPNGPNCALPGGGVLGEGRRVTLSNGRRCTCRTNPSSGVTMATCTPRHGQTMS